MVKRAHQAMCSLLTLNGGERQGLFFTKQFLLFGYLQAISCVFPVIIFLSLGVSHFSPDAIPRYDFLLIVLIGVQILMYRSGMETRDELLVICLFHLLGVCLEWFKVFHGSWSYPEAAYTRFFGVPVYAGFMYASVGSYICQAWRNLSLTAEQWPGIIASSVCALLIYANFFTNAFFPDLRIYLFILLLVIFRKASFTFALDGHRYRIHALLSFLAVGFFIWLAENIATFFGAWQYAYQHKGWKMVGWHKITSWSLLVIVSIIIVAELKRIKGGGIGWKSVSGSAALEQSDPRREKDQPKDRHRPRAQGNEVLSEDSKNAGNQTGHSHNGEYNA